MPGSVAEQRDQPRRGTSFETGEKAASSPARVGRRMALAWIAWIVTGLATAGAMPTATASCLRDGDEVWIVCTRHLTTEVCAANLTQPAFAVQRYDSFSGFVHSSTDELLVAIEGSPQRGNVIYAHGNRFSPCDAVERASFIYGRITANRSTDQSIRLIIWSWPSEQVGLLLKDARVKAERTDSQGLYLAWLLREMSTASPAPLNLLGYSFGGRVVTGSLHALAGGALDQRRLPGHHIRGLSAHVGLIAAAVDRDWMLAGEYHGLATKNMNRMTLMYNPRDRVLRQYWLLDPLDLTGALGAAGPVRFGTRNDGTRLPVRAINCSRTVGRRHDELDYMSEDCGGGREMAALIENRPLAAERR